MKILLLLLFPIFLFSQPKKIKVTLEFEIVSKTILKKDTIYICKNNKRIRMSKDTIYIYADKQYLKVKK
jgi:hypothetical protein